MKKPALLPGAGGGSGAAATENVTDWGACPYASECSHLVSEVQAPETADCRFCGQTFSRAELVRYLEGTL